MIFKMIEKCLDQWEGVDPVEDKRGTHDLMLTV